MDIHPLPIGLQFNIAAPMKVLFQRILISSMKHDFVSWTFCIMCLLHVAWKLAISFKTQSVNVYQMLYVMISEDTEGYFENMIILDIQMRLKPI